MTVGYSRQRLADFSVEQIALGFINSIKILALGDAKAILPRYFHIDNEYDDDPVRIRMDSASSAARGERTNANVMYALRTLPVILMNDNYLAGVNFFERYRGWPLYNGVFDNKNDPRTLQPASEPVMNASLASTQRRRSLVVRQSNDNSTTLSIPGSNPDAYEIKIFLLGREIPKKAMFAVILEFLFALGLENAGDEITRPTLVDQNLPAWIFAMDNSESTTPFQIFHLLGILEAIARHCVLENSYRELVFDFFAGDQYVAGGCVTKADNARAWCRGLRGKGQQSILTET